MLAAFSNAWSCLPHNDCKFTHMVPPLYALHISFQDCSSDTSFERLSQASRWNRQALLSAPKYVIWTLSIRAVYPIMCYLVGLSLSLSPPLFLNCVFKAQRWNPYIPDNSWPTGRIDSGQNPRPYSLTVSWYLAFLSSPSWKLFLQVPGAAHFTGFLRSTESGSLTGKI